MALWGNVDNNDGTSKPKFLSSDEKENVYGVDASASREEAMLPENRAKGIDTPGWVKYVTYTDSEGNTRHKSEVLVAMSSITGDASDDSVVADD
jgi:hypothetical protein